MWVAVNPKVLFATDGWRLDEPRIEAYALWKLASATKRISDALVSALRAK
jgi:hypothetical protein